MRICATSSGPAAPVEPWPPCVAPAGHDSRAIRLALREVWPRIAASGRDREPRQEVSPALGMARRLARGQAIMDELDRRPLSIGDQRHLKRAGAGREPG